MVAWWRSGERGRCTARRYRVAYSDQAKILSAQESECEWLFVFLWPCDVMMTCPRCTPPFRA